MLHIPSASGLPFLGKELKVTVFLKKMAWLISNLPLASSPLSVSFPPKVQGENHHLQPNSLPVV